MLEDKMFRYAPSILKTFIFFLQALLLCFGSTTYGKTILESKHNLSVTGPGDIKAVTEERFCIFCHVPHHASPVTPLWSRPMSSTVIYDLYQSSTLLAKPGQPSGTSKLCLSCHDGTVAMGALYLEQYADDPGMKRQNYMIEMAGGFTTIPVDRSTNIGGATGSSLNDDHPISFPYTAQLAQQNGQLKLPSELSPKIHLEQGSVMQCTSCHHPCRGGTEDKFLVMTMAKSALCIECHTITGWSTSAHATSPVTELAGCTICHANHNAKKPQRLLTNVEGQECLACHKPASFGKDIQSQLTKPYTHPVTLYSNKHDAAESVAVSDKHVVCEDCHNSHQLNSTTASPPYVMGELAGAKGIDVTGASAVPAVNEYEVCFRCHADNPFTAIVTVTRQIQDFNTRLDFSTLNPSYHPVVGSGKGTNVPSLRPGLTTASMIYCTDCHGADDSIKAGGTAPNGPHGSMYEHILIAQYRIDTYPLAYSDNNYSLCYRCHDQNILLDPARSAFPPHRTMVVDKGVPCSACHDPHGVSLLRGGTPSANAHLINFNTLVVTSATYDSVARSCNNVSCHTSNPRFY